MYCIFRKVVTKHFFCTVSIKHTVSIKRTVIKKSRKSLLNVPYV